MEKKQKKKLLKDRRVVDEINRHLWIESEKAGHDIGFDNAAAQWLENFSKAWLDYHMPKKSSSQNTPASSVSQSAVSAKKTTHAKKK